MKFTSARTIENIHLIYQLLIKEQKTAYDLAEDMCCSKPTIYFYLCHMQGEGFIKEVGKLNNRTQQYRAVLGVNLPALCVEPILDKEQLEAEVEAEQKIKLQKKFKKIVPFR